MRSHIMNAIHVREGEPADASAIARLLFEALTPTMKCASIYGDRRSAGYLHEVLEQGPAVSGRRIHVAEFAAEILGVIIWRPTHPAHLDHIAVRPDVQGSGLGTHLLGVFEAYAGLPCQLDCFASNERAMKLYLDRGYTPGASTHLQALKLPRATVAVSQLGPTVEARIARDLARTGFANVTLPTDSTTLHLSLLGDRGVRVRQETGMSVDQLTSLVASWFPEREYLIVPPGTAIDRVPLFDETSVRMEKQSPGR